MAEMSYSDFERLFQAEQFYLPLRWDGVDFCTALKKLLDFYIQRLQCAANRTHHNSEKAISFDLQAIEKVCKILCSTAEQYLNGFPSDAYHCFESAMEILFRSPLKIYQKSSLGPEANFDDTLDLFRVVRVNDNRPYDRTRVFHTPFNLRSKISTNRYSIAGYPSLYLGTSLKLCCNEIHVSSRELALAAKFKLERDILLCNTNIQVLELGVKPQDFLDHRSQALFNIPEDTLSSQFFYSDYLLWYPLIASCSFIRVCKSDPFSAEYIIPQLLMQWIRHQVSLSKGNGVSQLMGVRYFSCASVRASEMGYNYVFPTSGKMISPDQQYCPILSNAFMLTPPVYIHEYRTITECEKSLKTMTDLAYLYP